MQAQTKEMWAARTRMCLAKTEEERNVAKAEMEAAAASAAAHDKHRECSVCRRWVKTPYPHAPVDTFVCPDPLCVRYVKDGKRLKALYGSAPTFADVQREYMKHYGEDETWNSRYYAEHDADDDAGGLRRDYDDY